MVALSRWSDEGHGRDQFSCCGKARLKGPAYSYGSGVGGVRGSWSNVPGGARPDTLKVGPISVNLGGNGAR